MAKLNVSKWQAARRGPSYTPVMQYFYRQIWMAMFEALRVKGIDSPYHYGWYAHGEPMLVEDGMGTSEVGAPREWNLWDSAIMARDWIRRGAPDPKLDREGWFLSFDAACLALGLQPDYERTWMLEKIDAAADFDTDEVWARIEYLTANPPEESWEALLDDDGKPLFDAPRCVPALDQGNLFAAMGAM